MGKKMKKTIIGLVPEESPIYNLHPLTRLVAFIITGFIPIFIDMPEINFLFILGIFLLFWYARVDLASLRIYVPMLVTVGVFIFLTYVFFPGTNPAYIQIGTIFGKKVYYQPLRWALVSYIRILALIYASIFYFSTNRERDILAGFRAMGMPFAVSYFAGLTLRAAGMFLEDYRTIREAEQARGLDLNSMAFIEKVKLYSMYMIPLFTIALRRGDEITNALFARGYSFSGKVDGKRRADYLLTKYRWSGFDIPAIAVMLIAFALVIMLDIRLDLFSVEKSPLNILLMRRIG